MEAAKNDPQNEAPPGYMPPAPAPAPLVTQQPVYMMPQMQQQQQQQQTNVVVNTGDRGPIRQNTRGWHTGMCGCFEDMGSCCMGWFCPTVLACTLAAQMNESCCVPIYLPGGLMAMRTKLRTQHGITGSICDDWCMTTYCTPLALCQMDRELKRVGGY